MTWNVRSHSLYSARPVGRLAHEPLETRCMLATMLEAGINAAGIAAVNAHPYADEIVADSAFQNTLRGLIETEAVPVGTPVITSEAGLSQIQAGGTWLIQGDLTLTQTFLVPSNVTIYVDGSIYYQGSHTIGGIHEPNNENLDQAIFKVHDSDNVNLIGINNARLQSNPTLSTTSPHASGVVITGNATNVLVEGFEMSHVWEGVASHWGTSFVTIQHNYIHDTLKRAIWFLNGDDCKAIHNFLQNPGADGIDMDAFTDRTLAYENVALGAGRWAGFVEEGAKRNYFVRGVAIMVDMGNPNTGFQMGWADNGTTQGVIDNGGLTEENYFIDNVSFRPIDFPDGGSYFAKWNKGKGQTYFWGNRGYGFTQNEANSGLMDLAEWLDTIPVAGGEGGAINGQQLLIDLANQYRHPTTIVDAGANDAIVLPLHVYALQPSVSTSAPVGSIGYQWTVVGGPDTVAFSDATQLSPTVQFRRPGSYALQLSVVENGMAVTDTVVIEVKPPDADFVSAVTDEFEAYDVGATPPANAPWSTKWDSNDVTQRNLFVIELGESPGDGQILTLDASTAERSYNAIHQQGVTGTGVVGDQLLLRADVKISLSGTSFDQGIDGTNQPFFGLEIRDDKYWYSGESTNFSLARRADGSWGVRLPSSPWIYGWQDNTQLGFSDNSGSAGTSDWVSIEVVLTDNGSTYDAVMMVRDATGSVLLDTAEYSWSTALVSGATLHGGFTTGWNNAPEGTTVQDLSKVSEVSVDNYSFSHATPTPVHVELGDFDADGDHDIEDLDALVAAIATAQYDLYYDISLDGSLSIADVNSWLSLAGGRNLGAGSSYLFGDANLDGAVDASDFTRWLGHNTTASAAWSGGDFDASGTTDQVDFQIWRSSSFQSVFTAQTVQAATRGLSPPTATGPMDVNQDGIVSPLDALWIINALNEAALGATDSTRLGALDVSRDGELSPVDALLVINQLNATSVDAVFIESSSDALRWDPLVFQVDEDT